MMVNSKTALLTGASGAIGKEIALGLASRGFDLILGVRDAAKGESLVKEIGARQASSSVHLEMVDLSSPESVKAFVGRVNANYPRLDVLINNAAIVPPTRQLTAGGLELQFMVNVLSYFMLMVGLAPLLRRTGQARVINVASNYAGDLDLEDLQFEARPYDVNTVYKQSKQANRMLTWAAADLLFKDSDVTVNAMHPGVVTSPLLQGLGMTKGWDTAEASAQTAIYLATSPKVSGVTGRYFVDQRVTPCTWQKHRDQCHSLWHYCQRAAEQQAGQASSSTS